MNTLLVVALLIALLVVPAHASEPAPGAKENRLAKARSPYLRQHRTNPVDWHPWGPEALALATTEDRPIFLSVGYAACHWCHVMEHESFEDEGTAALMNETFVCVKVDREERPDIDRAYMSAVQLFGRGGWPMTVLLLPDGRPFLGATYLPRDNLQALCRQIDGLWKNDRDRILKQAAMITTRVKEMANGPDVDPVEAGDDELLAGLTTALAARFDPQHAGYGDPAGGYRPKFPPHSELLFALEDEGVRSDEEARHRARQTLDAMERGGIHDHVGGGFHRYSTDRAWLLPHFEKMLYDNALLLRAYAAGASVFGEARYVRVCERLIGWLDRELAQPGGGYASSLDADTEGEEGTTYTWTLGELTQALGQDDAGLVAMVSRANARGNFEDESTHQATGRNIVHVGMPLDEAAKVLDVGPARAAARFDAALDRLLAPRLARVQPGLDDKVITGWNGLLVSGLARAGRLLERPAYLAKAKALASFLLARCRRDDGALLRFPRGGGAEIPGFCEDYVHVIEGLLDLAEITGEAVWRTAADELGRRLVAEFEDARGGGFFTSSSAQHESLFTRSKETWDSPIPSDNGTAIRACLRLHDITGEASYRQAADRALRAYRPLLGYARMAPGVVAIFRALLDRRAQDEAAGRVAVRGDVHTTEGVATLDVFAEHQRVAAGQAVGVVLRLRLEEGWHVQAMDAAPPAVATTLSLGADSMASLEGLEAPPPAARGDERVLEGTFLIRAALVVPDGAPSGPWRIPLRVRIQPCDAAGTCLAPQELAVDLPLRVGAERDAPRHPAVFAPTEPAQPDK